MVLTGPDVSHWQGEVNWQAVKAAGHTYGFCKATDGVSYATWVPYFRRQFAGMKAAGLVPGAYHWLQPGDGAAQARYYVSIVQNFSGVLAVVDVEKNPNGTFPSIGTLRAFAAEFARLTGGHPLIVYTGRWFWVDHLKNPHGADIGPLWHSEYEPSQAEINDGPELDQYGGWPGATFWQYTSSGSCPGIGGRCDLNVFYGTHAQLAALASGQHIERDWFDMATQADLEAVVGAVGLRLIAEFWKAGQTIDFVADPEGKGTWLVALSSSRWLIPADDPDDILGAHQRHWAARGYDTQVQGWTPAHLYAVPVANGEVTLPPLPPLPPVVVHLDGTYKIESVEASDG